MKGEEENEIKEETKREITRKAKPETLAKEVAMEAPERESSSRWPTIMTEITGETLINNKKPTMGAAMRITFFISSRHHLPPFPTAFHFESYQTLLTLIYLYIYVYLYIIHGTRKEKEMLFLINASSVW